MEPNEQQKTDQNTTPPPPSDQTEKPEQTQAPEVSPAAEALEEPTEPKKRFHFLRHGNMLALLAVIVVIVAAGGYALWHKEKSAPKPVQNFQAPVTPFKLVSISPAKDTQNVDPSTPITLTFNKPVTPAELNGNFFTTPMVNGTFSQGATPEQVVFTPSVPFQQATKVQIMMNGTLQSASGSKLGANMAFNFTTTAPPNSVLFDNSSGFLANVDSAPANQKESFTLDMADDANSANSKSQTADITLYKANMDSLLNSLIYINKSSNGGTYQDFANSIVDTSNFTKISSETSVKNGASYSVTQGNGVYLAVATTGGKQVGHVWVVYSDFGVVLRQDDQKAVFSAQHFDGSGDVSASLKLYNLLNSQNLLSSSTVNGLGSVNLPYSPTLDAVVASDGVSQAFVPVSVLDSLGDIRNEQDLSKTKNYFGLTDKPTYKTGESVHFAGFARTDNDAQYSLTGATSVAMYVAPYPGGDHLADFSVPVSANGSFNDSFVTKSSWVDKADSSSQLYVYATGVNGNNFDDAQVASFNVVSKPSSSSLVKVKFGKASYLPKDTVAASVTGVNSVGKPLSNLSVKVHIYAKDYYENDTASNLNSFGSVGEEIKGSPQTVKLNSQGVATVNVNVTNLPNDGFSQVVTIQAGYTAGGLDAAGGDSAIVHQGNGYLEFGPGRSVANVGGQVVARIYAKQLNGAGLANAKISYVLMDTPAAATSNVSAKQVASGSVTANGSGYAQIIATLPSSVKLNDALDLDVSTGDSQNNKLKAVSYYYVGDSNASDTSGAVLQDIDVSGAPSTLIAGSTVNLTINSPADLRTLITMDRGRINNSQMLNLKKGNNNFNFTVDSKLAPSFTLTFNYFKNGIYRSEGVQFNVMSTSKQASLLLTASKSNITIQAKSAGGGALSTNLIVGATSSNAYNVSNPVVADMFSSFYVPRVLTTSSSSSLSGVGSGGGKCGGGGPGTGQYVNPTGTNAVWKTSLTTDAKGKASVGVSLPHGTWTVYAYSMSKDSEVASAITTVTVK